MEGFIAITFTIVGIVIVVLWAKQRSQDFKAFVEETKQDIRNVREICDKHSKE